jgi:hypothetical protein
VAARVLLLTSAQRSASAAVRSDQATAPRITGIGMANVGSPSANRYAPVSIEPTGAACPARAEGRSDRRELDNIAYMLIR